MSTLPSDLKKIIQYLKKLPGVGSRSAERFAFNILSWEDPEVEGFCQILSQIKANIPPCHECGCLTEKGHCLFCHNPKRDPLRLCVVATYKDVCNIENTQSYSGLYHVLGTLISPLDGKGVEKLDLDKLRHRVLTHKVEEVILALDSTVEGDTTSFFIKDLLKDLSTKITRLAFGMPVGSPLEYVDGSTLLRALSSRHNF